MKVSFILHPLNFDDFKIKFKGLYFPISIFLSPFFYFSSPFLLKKIFSKLSPHKVMNAKNIQSKTGKIISCSFIMLPLFSEQIIHLGKERIIEELLKTLTIAKRDGSKLAALGGFTSIISDQGRDINGKVNIAVTSGNSLTAGLCIEGIIKSADLLNKNTSNCTLAIIGALGDIGMVCSKILVRRFKKIILCSRKITKEALIVKEIGRLTDKEINLEVDANNAVKNADFVLVATSAFGPIIDFKNFKKNAIVCDVSLPYNISRSILINRKDVFVFEGGKAKIPFPNKIRNKKWHDLMPNNSIYGCLAEAIVLGFEDNPISYSLGRGSITEERINYILSLANKHGIELANFSYYNIENGRGKK